MGEVAKFLGRKTGHVLRNAMHGLDLNMTALETDASSNTTNISIVNSFGNIGVTAHTSHAVHITFANAFTAASPVFALAMHGVSSHGGADDHRFGRIVSTATNSCVVAVFDGDSVQTGRFDLGVYGVVRGDSLTA